MTQTNGGASPAEIAKHLEGLRLPASKQDVVRHVRSKGANQDEITALQRLPDQEFKAMADILKASGRLMRLGRDSRTSA